METAQVSGRIASSSRVQMLVTPWEQTMLLWATAVRANSFYFLFTGEINSGKLKLRKKKVKVKIEILSLKKVTIYLVIKSYSQFSIWDDKSGLEATLNPALQCSASAVTSLNEH